MSKQGAPPPGGIQKLITQNKGDRSYDRLSKDCGGKPSGPALQKMVTVSLRAFPDVESIRGLSRGLNVPVRDVLHACARSVGLNIADDDDDALSIVGGRRLPKVAQDSILNLARELMNAYEQAWGAEEKYELAASKKPQNIEHDQIEEVP